MTDTAGNLSVLGVVGDVWGVTQLHDVIYMISWQSSTIRRYNAVTLRRLADIDVDDLIVPRDIAACEETSQLYLADWGPLSVWRVSADGGDIQRWLPRSPDDTFKPWTLSVTSTRLLVTSYDTRQLMQFDADGEELRRVQLSLDVEQEHAVESPTGTFIIGLYNKQLKQNQVVEVDTEGEVLRQFSGSPLPSLGLAPHAAVDSNGNVFVVDEDNHRILLLDAHLSLRRVIIDEHQLYPDEPPANNWPRRLCYIGEKLLVGLYRGFAKFDVL